MTWRRRPAGSQGPDDTDDGQITPEVVAWRIGASDARPAPPPGPAGDPAAVAAPASAEPAAAAGPAAATSRRGGGVDRRGPHAHPVVPGRTRRILLWRDASALLFVLVLAVFVAAQLTLPGDDPRTAAGPSSSVGAPPTQDALGTTATPLATTAPPTIGPVVDPSLIPNIEATPTPLPTATPRPAPTPRPTPRPTPLPSAPTPSAPPLPTPTAAPPVAAISASPQCGDAPLSVHFDASSSTGVSTYAWDFDDGTGSTAGSVDHTFDGAMSTYNVILTVTGPGGTDFTAVTIHVPCT